MPHAWCGVGAATWLPDLQRDVYSPTGGSCGMLLDTVTPQVLDCMGGCSPCAPSSPGVLEGDTWSSDTERPSHSQRRAAKQGVCVCVPVMGLEVWSTRAAVRCTILLHRHASPSAVLCYLGSLPGAPVPSGKPRVSRCCWLCAGTGAHAHVYGCGIWSAAPLVGSTGWPIGSACMYVMQGSSHPRESQQCRHTVRRQSGCP
jgi:hypothetical protein